MLDSLGDAMNRRDFARGLGLSLGPLIGAVKMERPIPGAASTQAPQSDLRSRLPALARYSAETVPGFSVAALVDGKIAWTEAHGVKSAGGTDRVTPDTVFEAASLTKPVTTCAVLTLRDEGVLDLDRPLLDYMAYPDVVNDPRGRMVTARMVMSHRTGLPNYREKTDLPFLFTPGERFGYSGEGFFWLQRVVEHLTNTPFARVMHDRVLRPLGMTRTSYVLRSEMMNDITLSHAERGKPEPGMFHALGLRWLELARRWNKPVENWMYEDVVRAARETAADKPIVPFNLTPNAAGSMFTTAGDYARFMSQFLNGEASTLPAKLRRDMLTPVTRVSPVTAFGLGWALEQDPDVTALYHFGGNRGFNTFAVGDPHRRIGIVLLTNSEDGYRLNWPVGYGFTGRGAAALLS